MGRGALIGMGLRRGILAALSLVAMVPGVAQAGTAPMEFQSAGPWNIDYDVNTCHLGRVFAAGDQRLFVVFDRSDVGARFELKLIGKLLKISIPYPISLQFGEKGQSIPTINPLVGKSDDRMYLLFHTALLGHKPYEQPKPETRVQADAITSMTLTMDSKHVYRLNLGPMGAPIAALDTCTRDLVRTWGYDPDKVSAAVPKGSPGEWISDLDYPTPALRQGLMAEVQFRLDVDEKGAVAGCKVLQTTKDPSRTFEQVTCDAIGKRARFQPPVDRDGRPARSWYVNSVHFDLPRQ